MADHVRKQIRDAVAAALVAASTAAGSRVFASRVYDVQRGELPCLLVYTIEEDSEPDTMTRPRGAQREAVVAVQAMARATADVDDTLDALCAEVEAALGNSLLSGLVKDLYLERTEIALVGDDAAESHGAARMAWRAAYRTVENDATAAA